MGYRDWILTGVIFTFAGSQIVPGYIHPFDYKEEYHTHVEGRYVHVGTTGDTTIVTSTGSSTITPQSGSLVTVGEAVTVELK